MPRQVAPPPSGEFTVRLSKPFSGQPTNTVEVIGEPNRPAVVRMSQYNGSNKTSEKVGDLAKDDPNELTDLIQSLRGFPTHDGKDIYGLDAVLEFNTFEIQWANNDEDALTAPGGEVAEVAPEQKEEFDRVVKSIEALGRQFAKRDSAV